LWLGCISFGGPAGQIAVMHAELVERRRWISERRFMHALNYCMVLPGPEAQQLATYIGWLMHRTAGGIMAGALFVLPSLVLLIALSWIYVVFGSVPWVAGVFHGVKPAVVAIVLHAAHRIGGRVLRNQVLWSVAVAAFVAIFVFQVSFPAIVLAAAAVGYLGGRVWPASFKSGAHGNQAGTSYGAALIDDHTPPPVHAQFRARRLVLAVLSGLALWMLPMLALTAAFGWQGTPTQMGWFFSKAALLTFGGAYAVLPYVFQGAVHHYGWLGAGQMMDGLALGESTPGPLIMVVAFVGFLGSYTATSLGAPFPVMAGILGALVATWFTFLPSFIFIQAGGPLVEAAHGELALTAPLTAISAAVVGVIANLALFFAFHVFWPQGLAMGVDWQTAWIALLAVLALFHFKRSVLEVIAASAVAGLLLRVFD
jgi:chromate transporter